MIPEADVSALCGWTIYRSPPEYPHHYAVQMWWVEDDCAVATYAFAALCATLEEAREQIPAGAICFPRDPEDAAIVVETWL